MTLDTLIMLTGAFVALLPFLGFPTSWDTVLLFVAGLLIITLGIILRRERGTKGQSERTAQTFVENNPRSEVRHEV